jgi:hypothetical protein
MVDAIICVLGVIGTLFGGYVGGKILEYAWGKINKPQVQILLHEENPREKTFIHHDLMPTVSGDFSAVDILRYRTRHEQFWIVQIKITNVERDWSQLNRSVPKFHGFIEFLDIQGNWIAAEPMPLRFDSPVEPVLPSVSGPLVHPKEVEESKFTELRPSETLVGDIAFRVETDPHSYGWCNESYYPGNAFDRRWQLPPGQYRVRVTLKSLDDPYLEWKRDFLLTNEGVARDIKLERID